MREALRKHRISVATALGGIRWAIRTQPNFRIHLFLSTLALIMAVWLKVSQTEYLILIFTIVLGLSSEMINTAIESMTDLITREWRQEAKIAKDVSAGMMLLTATGALLVAAIIFLPYLFGK
jgi:diacylglycerol kinase